MAKTGRSIPLEPNNIFNICQSVTFVQRYMWKIVSEVVPVPDTIISDGLNVIDLFINKRYIKQTFCFGFSYGCGYSCGCYCSVLSQQKSLPIFGLFQSGT